MGVLLRNTVYFKCLKKSALFDPCCRCGRFYVATDRSNRAITLILDRKNKKILIPNLETVVWTSIINRSNLFTKKILQKLEEIEIYTIVQLDISRTFHIVKLFIY